MTTLYLDELTGPLAGLLVAEVEVRPTEIPSPPSFALREITGDPTYSCGRLATLTPDEARTLLETSYR